MAVKFTDLSAWITRIRDNAAGIAFVGGAADLATAIDSSPPRLPAVYVIPEASARAIPSDLDETTVTDGVGVSIYIAVSNVRDSTGEKSLTNLRTARQAVADALDGWNPDATFDAEVRWQTGQSETFDTAVLWWFDLYSYIPLQ